MGNNFLSDTPGNHSVQGVTPIVALGSDGDQPCVVVPFNSTLTGIVFIPAAAITGDDTNNLIVKFKNAGQAGAGTTELATKTYATGVNSAAKVHEVFTLSSTAANLVLTAGDEIIWDKTETGSGLASVTGIAYFTFAAR